MSDYILCVRHLLSEMFVFIFVGNFGYFQLTAALTGVISKVRFHITNERFLAQLSTIGCLLHFEGLLSCHGSELGMLDLPMLLVKLVYNIIMCLVPKEAASSIISTELVGQLN